MRNLVLIFNKFDTRNNFLLSFIEKSLKFLILIKVKKRVKHF